VGSCPPTLLLSSTDGTLEAHVWLALPPPQSCTASPSPHTDSRMAPEDRHAIFELSASTVIGSRTPHVAFVRVCDAML
jgi:hypothetical protein